MTIVLIIIAITIIIIPAGEQVTATEAEGKFLA